MTYKNAKNRADFKNEFKKRLYDFTLKNDFAFLYVILIFDF